MATTSGSYTYALTRDQLIFSSFSLMGVYDADSPPPPAAMITANTALNLMIKTWMTNNYHLWCYSDVSITPVIDQTSYLLGPGLNSAFATFRPLRIPRARLIYGFPTPHLQVPLIELSREEYNGMGQPGATGTPNSFYYDPQLNQGVLYLYLTPNTAINTVTLTCQRPIQDMLTGTDAFDFPIEWLNAIKFGLANELCFDFDVPDAKAARIEKRATGLLEGLTDFDQESASTFFTPNPQYSGNRRGR